MAATILTPPTEIIHLTGISWQTYERLLMVMGVILFSLVVQKTFLSLMMDGPDGRNSG